MNYKKEYDGKASAIITDAYIFPNWSTQWKGLS